MGREGWEFKDVAAVAVDRQDRVYCFNRGDLYVGEVSYTEYPRLFPDSKIPWRMRSLQKLEKLP